MKVINLEKLPRKTLIELTRMYSRNWQTLDGLWFGNVEAECGLDTAVKVDLKNWDKMALLEAKRIKKVLQLDKGGLDSVLTAVSMMSWQLASPLFKIQLETPERVVFYYAECAVQESRHKNQKQVFPCKTMKTGLFKSVASVIEPRAEVRCINCPPDEKMTDCWCKWELTLKTE